MVNYGNPGFVNPPPQPYQQPQGNGMAVAGMVLGIIGIVTCWIPFFGWLLALLGLIFGFVGMSKAKRTGVGNGMAVTGIVLGALGLIIGVTLFVLAMRAVKEVHDRFDEDMRSDRFPATSGHDDLAVPSITPSTPSAGATADEPDINKQFDDMADRACACKDKACAEKVLDEFVNFVRTHEDSGDFERGRQAGEKFGKCVIAAGVSPDDLLAKMQEAQKALH
ncbi:MAG TPA: DUF4190 domain-containing protein [Kofleriaceae bacterium]|nr:DUF4190 domain-containing protein [Kofleriaceae bacterium]